MTTTKTFRATHKKFKGEFSGPWRILSWDFVNRCVYVLPETDDHLEGGSQLEWSYDDIMIEQMVIIEEESGVKRRWLEIP